ncbi:hypothetical protein C8N40_104168 [Pontibacter mucosus]|uniref:Uncharacterized protein n=1 Tax=Pontibacter mucosus TaxID=1649266 RepID=A0A2T5YJF8_9BACT|nr:hypothetical protein [Pontibacter mucosus]PTX19436.1 hypothetical protein C8N40_104168 [Pontibacter mucosus]
MYLYAMPYSPALLAGTTNHLQRIFDVENLPATNLEALEFKLAHIVQQLLRNDFSRLLHILYRIDVDEQKVKEAMIDADEEIIATRIARLIIKREIQKAEIRLRYSGH